MSEYRYVEVRDPLRIYLTEDEAALLEQYMQQSRGDVGSLIARLVIALKLAQEGRRMYYEMIERATV